MLPVQRKLAILADAAKYAASCPSGGTGISTTLGAAGAPQRLAAHAHIAQKSHALCVVARHLIERGAPPEQVTRVTASRGEPQALTLEPAPAITVGADFMSLCEIVILHSDHARFELLYPLLWRMAREPGLQHDPLGR